MSELIEKLRKLAQHVDCFSTSGHCVLCQIESLTPEIEAALAHEKEQRAGNLEAWKAACASLVLVTEKLAAFKADLAALTEKMPCTHPRACWVNGELRFSEIAWEHYHAAGHCAACADRDARVRLEVAAALRKAAITSCWYCQQGVPMLDSTTHDNSENTSPASSECFIHPPCRGAVVIALIPAADASLLAEHDAELVERMKDHLESMEGWMPPERIRAYVRQKVAAAKGGRMARLDDHDTHVVWKDGIDLDECFLNCRLCRIEKLEAELAALTEKMECGHPKACWEQLSHGALSLAPINPQTFAPTPSGRCAACADRDALQAQLHVIELAAKGLQPLKDDNDPRWSPAYLDVVEALADRDARVRLEITALLRMAAEAVKGTAGHSAVAVQKVLALIPAADASALDTYVEEQLASELNITAVKLLLTAEGWLTPESVQEKVAEARLAHEIAVAARLGAREPHFGAWSEPIKVAIEAIRAASPSGDSGGAPAEGQSQ